MLTKGIIQSINTQENTCIVRIPIFEIAGNAYKNEAEAIFAVPPGVYGGFHENDVVIVGFEENLAGKPIILGKLYLGTAEEAKNIGGAVQCTDLVVKGSATLPSDITILFDKATNISNAEVELQNYSSLYDITSAVIKNSKRILDLENAESGSTPTTESSIYDETEREVGTWFNKKLYRKTIVYDFISHNVGQEQNSYWSCEIPLNISSITRSRILYDFSYSSTSKTNIDASPANAEISYYDSSARALVIETQENAFTTSINNTTSKIEASGTTKNYTLKIGYFTVEYTKD